MATHRLSATRISTFSTSGSVFSEFTALANAHGSVNLGQGAPSLAVAGFVQESLADSVTQSSQQYARSEGYNALVQELTTYYSPTLNRFLNPLSEIIVTVGASEAIYSTIHALINPGDRVVLLQPYYDSYVASVLLAGGVPVVVSLVPSTAPTTGSVEWELDFDELKTALKDAKLLVLNNPHNPLGKVFTRNELSQIAEIVKDLDNVIVLADEVYETLTFEKEFIKFASLDGMFEKTVTVGSVGKMFGVTGWKVGWAISTPQLCKSIQLVHQFIPFCVSTPLQHAISLCFQKSRENNYFSTTRDLYKKHRDLLFDILHSVGLNPVKPDAGYFVLANIEGVKLKHDTEEERRDYAFCRELTVHCGVTAIPVSAFYETGHKDVKGIGEKWVRFAFCKDEKDLREAGRRLEKYFLEE